MSTNRDVFRIPLWVRAIDSIAEFIQVTLLSRPSKKDALKAKYMFKKIARAGAGIQTPLPDVEFLVYYGDKSGRSHFQLWDPVFDQLSDRYASVFRHSKMWWDERDDDGVFAIGSINHITPLFARMPNLKAIFYPANNGVNLQAIRNGQVQHVFLGHGDSDKASSANKVFRLYDEVWTAGQSHIDRFDQADGNYSSIDFKIIGQPWMKDWLKSLPNYQAEERIQWGYFPTWAGNFRDSSYASTHLFDAISSLANDAIKDGKGFVKLHPWSNPEDVSAIAATCENFGNGITLVPQENQLRDVLSQPLKFLLCDVSGALTECLYLNIPIFLYRPPPPALLSDDFEKQNAFCYIYTSPKELEALLQCVIVEGDDYLAKTREEFLTYRVNIGKTSSGQFFDEVQRLSEM